jgi:hypothetical protein
VSVLQVPSTHQTAEELKQNTTLVAYRSTVLTELTNKVKICTVTYRITLLFVLAAGV